MKTYTPEELAEVLEKHRLWLYGEEGGEQADLRSADLSYANLRSANLRSADLRSADLSYANLSYANLCSANLCSADLRSADLSYANLGYANLSYANLCSANLCSANLCSADLRSADLCSADLSSADLSYANLRSANLRSANLCELYSIQGLIGNLREVKAIQADIWPVTYTATHMQIGCQLHTLAEWWAFGDCDISRMDSRALGWWAVWKPILQQIIEASPAVPHHEDRKNG